MPTLVPSLRIFQERSVRLALAVVTGVVTVVGPATVAISRADDPATEEAAYRSLPRLPEGDAERGRAGVERTAIELAHALRAVPVDADGSAVCPRESLRVSWEVPAPGFHHGAYVLPIGPPPDDRTVEVNGVVVCGTSAYAYMGFEAAYSSGRWNVTAVPFVGDEEAHFLPGAPADVHAEHHHGERHHDEHAPAPAAAPAPFHVPALPTAVLGGAIEGYAPYEPQRSCSPAAKPGTVALRDLLLGQYSGTRNLGISRACSVGGQSEHKEGRALDWGVLVSRPLERAAAEHFVGRLLATDAAGNRHAVARRMGVMYIIWNREIWSSHRAAEGWRPYRGVSPHTDHVHVSLSWAGAMGRTSFWSGKVDPALVLGATWQVGGSTGVPSQSGGSATTAGSGDRAVTTRRREEEPEREHRDRTWSEPGPPPWAPAHGWRNRQFDQLAVALAAHLEQEAEAAAAEAAAAEAAARAAEEAAAAEAEADAAADREAAAPASAAVGVTTAARSVAAAPSAARGKGPASTGSAAARNRAPQAPSQRASKARATRVEHRPERAPEAGGRGAQGGGRGGPGR